MLLILSENLYSATRESLLHREQLKQCIRSRDFKQLRSLIDAKPELLFENYRHDSESIFHVRICSTTCIREYAQKAQVLFRCWIADSLSQEWRTVHMNEEFVPVDEELANFFTKEMSYFIRTLVQKEINKN